MYWTIAKALLTLIPFLIRLYEEGKIKKATEEEILDAMAGVWVERIAAAVKAKDGPLVAEENDPFNRTRREPVA
jgi:hypothetical protein